MDRGEVRSLQIGAGWLPEQMGGLNRVYYELWRSLPAVGVGFRGVVVGGPAAALETNGAVLAAASSTAPLPARLWAVRRALCARLRQGDIDVVAAHFALYAFAALDRLRERPLVAHFHGPWALESEAEGQSRLSVGLKAAVERAVYGRANRFIVLSRAFGGMLSARYGVDPEKTSVVPGGVDVARFSVAQTRSEARAHLGWPGSRYIILCPRRLVRRMGLGDLLSACAVARESRPDAFLVVLGKGPLEGELKARAAALGLSEHVRFDYLSLDDLPLAYRAADLTVVPSTAFEGFGLVAVESLAAGTPVLVTPVGGLPEAVAGLGPDAVLPGCGRGPIAEGLKGAMSSTLRLPGPEACLAAARAHDWPVVARAIRAVYEKARG
ncbi:MAG: glycosyltransferase family 4 protein [Elusimicrobia bacterium]|nr:glycosyltransferase family 4 protein [Elusimicrobiota bacterium]